ncbi:MAG: hypothetical protein EBT03_05605 [Betaproteobacteria bacterium]|nr:hypothetical protein [Betaproteobacteria bacterium]
MALPDDEYFMGLALEQAQHSASEGEVPVGAVVVRENSLHLRPKTRSYCLRGQ